MLAEHLYQFYTKYRLRTPGLHRNRYIINIVVVCVCIADSWLVISASVLQSVQTSRRLTDLITDCNSAILLTAQCSALSLYGLVSSDCYLVFTNYFYSFTINLPRINYFPRCREDIFSTSCYYLLITINLLISRCLLKYCEFFLLWPLSYYI